MMQKLKSSERKFSQVKSSEKPTKKTARNTLQQLTQLILIKPRKALLERQYQKQKNTWKVFAEKVYKCKETRYIILENSIFCRQSNSFLTDPQSN